MASKGKVTASWTITGDLRQKIDKFPGEFDKAVGTYLDFQATKVQDYMRSNAKWNDQTGNARGGLFAKYYTRGRGPGGGVGTHVIVMYHTVPYGIFLETMKDGGLAIINPTLAHYGPQLMAGSREIIGSMG